MKKFLIILVAMMAMATSSAHAQLSLSTLKEAAAEVNAECPIDQGNGMYIKSITCSDTQLTYSFLFKGIPGDALNQMAGKIGPELLSTFKSDPDTNLFIESCKSNKLKMVFKFLNEKGEGGTCTIPYYNL